jgi:hypothetical protein
LLNSRFSFYVLLNIHQSEPLYMNDALTQTANLLNTIALTLHAIISLCRCQWPSGPNEALQPIACWDCGFESHRGHGCLSVVSVVCLSGRSLCDGLITRPEESYRLRTCNWMWLGKPHLEDCWATIKKISVSFTHSSVTMETIKRANRGVTSQSRNHASR